MNKINAGDLCAARPGAPIRVATCPDSRPAHKLAPELIARLVSPVPGSVGAVRIGKDGVLR